MCGEGGGGEGWVGRVGREGGAGGVGCGGGGGVFDVVLFLRQGGWDRMVCGSSEVMGWDDWGGG